MHILLLPVVGALALALEHQHHGITLIIIIIRAAASSCCCSMQRSHTVRRSSSTSWAGTCCSTVAAAGHDAGALARAGHVLLLLPLQVLLLRWCRTFGE
jgi:hypothetical protein